MHPLHRKSDLGERTGRLRAAVLGANDDIISKNNDGQRYCFGNWDIFLNVINVEAEGGISAERLREALYGLPEPGPRYDPIAGQLYVEVLRPLCWLGLLQVVGEERMASRSTVYAKTPLWHAALQLDTDASSQPILKH